MFLVDLRVKMNFNLLHTVLKQLLRPCYTYKCINVRVEIHLIQEKCLLLKYLHLRAVKSFSIQDFFTEFLGPK